MGSLILYMYVCSESVWHNSSKGSLRTIINADRSLINMKSRNRSFFGLLSMRSVSRFIKISFVFVPEGGLYFFGDVQV